MRTLLVPDLAIERWPSMDRYANRLVAGLSGQFEDVQVSVAGNIDALTEDRRGPVGTESLDPAMGRRIPTSGFRELRRYVARYVSYPRRVRRMAGDLVHVLDHSYGHILLSEERRPTVVTVHDLLPAMSVRKRAKSAKERLRNALLARVLKGLHRANGYIVATEWIRNELAEFLGDDHRIHLVPYGVDQAFFDPPPLKRDEFRDRVGIPHDAFVILHVGSVGPRKNLSTVIRSFATLHTSGVPAWLLQIGGTLSDAQIAEIEALGVRESVTPLGVAKEHVLRSAYRAADVLLFPSLYEGFGFPVLEAMAAGLPAIASDAGALPEVGGEAAVIISGRETEPYVSALHQVLDNPSWRDQLVARGRARARTFTWAATAQKTAEVYRHFA